MARHYRRKGFVVACEDEATYGLIPLLCKGWARRGSRPVAQMNFRQDSISVMGARTLNAFVFSFCKRKTKRRFVRFLRMIKKIWGRVFLITDSAPWHKGREVEHFLRTNKKTFKMLYFPIYTPELNPVEQCWKPARKILSNRLLQTLPAAQYHLRKVFSNAKAMPKMFKYLQN